MPLTKMTTLQKLNTLIQALRQRTKTGSLQWEKWRRPKDSYIVEIDVSEHYIAQDGEHEWKLSKPSLKMPRLHFDYHEICYGTPELSYLYEEVSAQVSSRDIVLRSPLDEALNVAIGGDARPPQKEGIS